MRVPCKAPRGFQDQEAHEAAAAALQSVLPLPWKEASAEAVNAVAYASRYRSEWFLARRERWGMKEAAKK
jgi:hypothetical protein